MAEPRRPGIALVPLRTPLRALPAALVLLLAAALAAALLDLPEPYPGLAEVAHEHLPETGVENASVAVLLSFRAWDTLLEVGLLVLALLGVFALRPAVWRTIGAVPHLRDTLVLTALTRLLIPTMLLAAGYLLWAGTKLAGGAFPAAAILGAGGVLLLLGGMARPQALNAPLARLLAAFGFALFLAVGLAVMPFGRAFLDYPQAWSYALIFGIEAALTVSIGVTLALFYAGAAQAPPDPGDPLKG